MTIAKKSENIDFQYFNSEVKYSKTFFGNAKKSHVILTGQMVRKIRYWTLHEPFYYANKGKITKF